MATLATGRFDVVPPTRLMGELRERWAQGQHVSAIGPTGCGKTQLLRAILRNRRYVMFFGTKLFDDSYDQFVKEDGYRAYQTYDRVPSTVNRAMIWPRFKAETPLHLVYGRQKAVFRPALSKLFYERGWTIVLDELHYLCKSLGLSEDAAMFHHQGRSSRLTMVNGFQRPAHVPLVVYGSSSHVFAWKTAQLDTDAKRLADFGGAGRRELQRNLSELERFEFVYIDPVNQSPPVRSKLNL